MDRFILISACTPRPMPPLTGWRPWKALSIFRYPPSAMGVERPALNPRIYNYFPPRIFRCCIVTNHWCIPGILIVRECADGETTKIYHDYIHASYVLMFPVRRCFVSFLWGGGRYRRYHQFLVQLSQFVRRWGIERRKYVRTCLQRQNIIPTPSNRVLLRSMSHYVSLLKVSLTVLTQFCIYWLTALVESWVPTGICT